MGRTSPNDPTAVPCQVSEGDVGMKQSQKQSWGCLWKQQPSGNLIEAFWVVFGIAFHLLHLGCFEVRTLDEWCNELAKIPLHHEPGTEQLGWVMSWAELSWEASLRWLYGYSHDVVGRILEATEEFSVTCFWNLIACLIPCLSIYFNTVILYMV